MPPAAPPAVAAAPEAFYVEIEGCRYSVYADAVGRRYTIVKAGSEGGYRVGFWHDGAVRCTCPGFSWRGYCRHLRKLRECRLLPPVVEESARERSPDEGQ